MAEKKQHSSKPIVVLSGPGCGAEPLCRALGEEPGMVCVGEAFNVANFDQPYNFWSYLQARDQLAKKPTLDDRAEQVGAWLHFLRQSHADRQPVIVVRYELTTALELGIASEGQTPVLMSILAVLGCHFLFLTRRNLVEQYCAWMLEIDNNDPAGRLGDHGFLGVTEIDLDVRSAVPDLEKMRLGTARAKSWFGEGTKFVELACEDLVANDRLSVAAVDKIANLIGRRLDFRPLAMPPLSGKALTSMVVNHAELAQSLKDTDFDGLLALPQAGFDKPRQLARNLNNYFSFKIINHDPLITFSSTDSNASSLARLVKRAPEFFDVPKAIHLIHYQWNLEYMTSDHFAARLNAAQALLPNHLLVALVSNDAELEIVLRSGFPAILANGSIFTDELVWTVRQPDVEGAGEYQAIYNARLDDLKRHELAAEVKDLLLVYPYALSGTDTERFDIVKTRLPRAFFANHELTKGQYKSFDQEFVSRLVAHSRVGLCLSKAEGFMRASIEYLLCGLPVVSTESIGGRDRYYVANHCVIARDDPDEIAYSVAKLASADFDRQTIRHHTLTMLSFDRHQFLLNLGRIGRAHLGKSYVGPKFDMFRGAIHFEHIDTTAKMLEARTRRP